MSAVVIKTRVQAENIDALNRKAKYASADLPNGSAVTLAWSATEGDEVFTATPATTGLEFAIGRKDPIVIATGSMLEDEHQDAWYLEVTSNSGVWMVVSPEVNKDVIGEIYKGLDPRRFTNVAGLPFDVIKLEVGDIIQVSKDFFYATKDPDTVTGATAVELTANGFEATV
jgi:hypothetical protein